ncbi:cleavage and polyadenylation specificity factor subunit 2 [Conglomerata obtusa]
MTTNFINLTNFSNNNKNHCYLIQIESYKFLINIGAYDLDYSYLQKHKNEILSCNAILISHFDLSYCGALPYLFKIGFDGLIYATVPVYFFGKILIKEINNDICRINDKIKEQGFTNKNEESRSDQIAKTIYTVADLKNSESGVFYSNEEINEIFEKISQVKYSQPIEIETNLIITAYRSGLALGGAIWNIKKGEESIVFCLDVNHRKENHIDGMETDVFKDATICVINVAKKWEITKKDQRRTFIKNVLKKYNKIIITVSNLRFLESIYEMNEILKDFTFKAKVLSNNGFELLENAKNMVEWAGGLINKNFGDNKNSPFVFENILFGNAINNNDKCIIVPGDLYSNPLLQMALHKIINDPKNSILYFSKDSIIKEILHGSFIIEPNEKYEQNNYQPFNNEEAIKRKRINDDEKFKNEINDVKNFTPITEADLIKDAKINIEKANKNNDDYVINNDNSDANVNISTSIEKEQFESTLVKNDSINKQIIENTFNVNKQSCINGEELNDKNIQNTADINDTESLNKVENKKVIKSMVSLKNNSKNDSNTVEYVVPDENVAFFDTESNCIDALTILKPTQETKNGYENNFNRKSTDQKENEKKFLKLNVYEIKPMLEDEKEEYIANQRKINKIKDEEKLIDEILKKKEEDSDDEIICADKEAAKKMFWFEYKTDFFIESEEDMKYAKFPDQKINKYDEYGEYFELPFKEIQQNNFNNEKNMIETNIDKKIVYDKIVTKEHLVKFECQEEEIDCDGMHDFISNKYILEIIGSKKIVMICKDDTVLDFYTSYFLINANVKNVYNLKNTINLSYDMNLIHLQLTDEINDKIQFQKIKNQYVGIFKGQIEFKDGLHKIKYIDQGNSVCIGDIKITDFRKELIEKGYKTEINNEQIIIEEEIKLSFGDNNITIEGIYGDLFNSVKTLLYTHTAFLNQ